MPLYEYQCEQCGTRFERIQKFSDPPADTCPKCGGPVKKLLSSPAIQFKGSGWYITDYAKKSSADAGKTGDNAESSATKSSTSSAGDSTSAKSNSKPADSGSKSKD
jgi:putative FmdB family regulatory protein